MISWISAWRSRKRRKVRGTEEDMIDIVLSFGEVVIVRKNRINWRDELIDDFVRSIGSIL